jgi:hypothetical protein
VAEKKPLCLYSSDIKELQSGDTLPSDPIMGINGSNTFYVDGSRTDTYVADGTIIKPFKTIMAAVNQVITNADNSWTNPYAIKIAATGNYDENIVLENAALYALIFEGVGFRQTKISPTTGIALQSTTANDNLAWLTFKNIWFDKGANLTGAGVNPATTWLGYNLFFIDCYFAGTGNVLFKNVSYPMFWGVTKFSNVGTLTFSNVTAAWMGPGTEVGSSVTSFVMETDESGGSVKVPYGWLTVPVGTKVTLNASASSKVVTFTLTNISTYTGTSLQVRATRFAGTSTTQTIPQYAAIYAYSATLLGNYTINSGGNLYLYGGSFVSGTLTNNGTMTLYQPANQVKNDSSVSGTTVKDALNTLAGLDYWSRVSTTLSPATSTDNLALAGYVDILKLSAAPSSPSANHGVLYSLNTGDPDREPHLLWKVSDGDVKDFCDTVLKVKEITASYDVLPEDQLVEIDSAAGGTVIITLPVSAAVPYGKVIIVKREAATGGGTVTLQAASGNIDNLASINMNAWSCYHLYYDADDTSVPWRIIAKA